VFETVLAGAGFAFFGDGAGGAAKKHGKNAETRPDLSGRVAFVQISNLIQ
jgi:hypothetical protein